MPRKRGKNQQFWNTDALNRATYMHYFDQLTELSISRFNWINLPNTIDPRYMEIGLFENGHVVFFIDEVIGPLCLRCALAGPMDIYNVPTRRDVITSNGYHASLNNTNSVIIYNNLMRKNTAFEAQLFAHRLYDLDRTIDVNTRAQKTPVLVQCDETQRLTLENVYNDVNGNKPAIFGSNALNKEGITCISTGAPYVADKIYELKTKIWNEALTVLGISNISASKKERMLVDEVNRNMGGVLSSRYSALEARKQACHQINEMFGLNIDCEFKDDLLTPEKEMQEDE